ncbi:glycosyltransferase family 2 protein [Natronosalvus caseinilyticus]|uniref:glycosyltransferase family 2 protein n=1 Tax=Natronosalvus caseinilyticus TaxID=2953747 RepID=UPI0028AAA157|nr:glycosyltransferase family 2 protein [Natronosalvus caseinilyticus]
MPRVSVIIPTYNRAGSLVRAIDSALEQTIDDHELEVVVVDDGSTDNTGLVLAEYDDPRVRPVVHATNQGANVARNTGIEHARGEYVAFLDSDDEWDPTKLEKQLAAFEGRGDDWIGAYCDTAFDLEGTSGRLRGVTASLLSRTDEQPTMEGNDDLIGEILSDGVQPGAGSTLLVRTDVAREIGGFDEDLDRFQDPEFCLRVLEQGKLAYVDEKLVVREETGHPPADVVRRADQQYLSKHEDLVERYEAEGYEIRSRHQLVLAKRYLAEGRLLRGAWHLRKAAVSARHYPGLLWATGSGVRRRPLPIVASLALVLVASTLGRRTLTNRVLDRSSSR